MQCAWVPGAFLGEMRPSGNEHMTIKWILDGQSELTRRKYSASDFGLKESTPQAVDPEQIRTSPLPSIKKSHSSIMKSMPSPGPTMHDSI